MAGEADLAEITTQYAKASIMQGKMKKSSVALLGAVKGLNQAFGPLFKFGLKLTTMAKGLGSVFKKTKKQTDAKAKAMEGLAEATEPVVGLFNKLKLGMLMTMGGIFAIIAAFGYLTGAFGQFAYEGASAGELFGKLQDAISGVIDYIKGIGERVSPVFMQIGENVMILAGIILGMDWSPITDMLMLAFGAIGMLIAEFAVAAIGFFGELFNIFTTLMTYLADTGILQQIIDIVGIVGTTVILVIGSIFAALDALGINFGSIFGFITDVVGGFVSFLIDSGLIGFFVDVMSVLALVLSTTGLVIAGIILIVADLLSYFTGPTWQILTGIIGAIADFIAITLAVVLGVVRVVLNLIMLPFRILFGFITGGWDGAKKGASKSLGNIGKIVKSTVSSIWDRLKSLAGNIGSVFVGAFNLITAPIQYVIDKVKDLIGYFTDLLDIDLGDIADKIPGAGAVGGAVDTIKGWFASGGISRGPESGYTAVLHGTEAVVPLPDGQSIPVNMRGATVQIEGQDSSSSGMRELNRTMRRMFSPISKIPQSIKQVFSKPLKATLEGEPIAHDIDIKVEHDGESEAILTTISGNIERLVKLMGDVPQVITGVANSKPAPVLDSWMRDLDLEVDVTHDPIEHDIDIKVEHDPIEVEVSQSPITINAMPAIKQLIRQLIKPIIAIPQVIGRLFEGRIIPVAVKSGVDPPEINLTPAVRAIDNLSGPITSMPQALASVFYGRVIPVSIRDDITVGRLLDGRTIPVSIQDSGETSLGENVTFNINVSGGGDASKIAKAVTREVQRAFRTRARSGGFGRGI